MNILINTQFLKKNNHKRYLIIISSIFREKNITKNEFFLSYFQNIEKLKIIYIINMFEISRQMRK